MVQAVLAKLAIFKLPNDLAVPVNQFQDAVCADREVPERSPVELCGRPCQETVFQQVGGHALRRVSFVGPLMHVSMR